MSTRIIKYFFTALTSQEKWLNKMAKKGSRLVKTDEVSYYFESCKPDEYMYKVQYVADKTIEELQEYQQFLGELGLITFSKPLAFGRYTSNAVTLRPYNKGKAMVAKAPGMINKELLIIEKINDGKPFEIYSDTKDQRIYNKTLLNFSLWGIIMADIIEALLIWDFQKMSVNFPTGFWRLFAFSALTILLIFLIYSFIRRVIIIRKLKDQEKTYE